MKTPTCLTIIAPKTIAGICLFVMLIALILSFGSVDVAGQADAPVNPFARVRENSDWNPDNPNNPQLFIDEFEVRMVYVPAGCFTMSLTIPQIDNRICLDHPYWIDETEVTNAQAQLVDADGTMFSEQGEFPGPQRPRDTVKWDEARRFCEARGARLPTEAEWVYAASGPSGWNYPWSDAIGIIDSRAVYDGNSLGSTADVRSMPDGRSWVGAYDMSGNLWEWTSSRLPDNTATPYYIPFANLDDPSHPGPRILRGGAYNSPVWSVDTRTHQVSPRGDNTSSVGFRCARDLIPPRIHTFANAPNIQFAYVSANFADFGIANIEPDPNMESFWMMIHEYPDSSGLPLVNVDATRARGLCEDIDGSADLPTMNQWIYAAVGNLRLNYTWGNTPEYYDPSLAPGGNREADKSWTGIFDMTGNVREWVYAQGQNFGTMGWAYNVTDVSNPLELSIAFPGTIGTTDIGFRCVVPV